MAQEKVLKYISTYSVVSKLYARLKLPSSYGPKHYMGKEVRRYL